MKTFNQSCARSFHCLWNDSLEWTKFGLSIFAIVLGVFVCLPFDTTTPFYLLGTVWPEWLWGTMLLVMGALQLMVSRSTPALVPDWCEAFSVLLGIVFWGGLALFTVVTVPNSTAGPVYFGFAFGWGLVLWKMPLDFWDFILDRFRWARALRRQGWPHGVSFSESEEQE